jgi:hypothetical protein
MSKSQPRKAKVVRTTRDAAKDRPKKAAASPRTKAPKDEVPLELPFTRTNYLLLLLGIGLIGLGFYLMSLDDFIDATKFSISLWVAPIVVMAGFLEIIYAIMYKPKGEEKPTPEV